MSDIEFEKELKVIDLVVLGDAGAWFKVDSQLAKMAALGLEQLNAAGFTIPGWEQERVILH